MDHVPNPLEYNNVLENTMTSRDIKDKRIVKAGHAYVATVELARHRVPGDDRLLDCGRHITMRSAQVELSKYPNDVFEGYDDPSHVVEVEKKRRYAPAPRKQPSYMRTRLYDRRIK